MFKLGIFDFKFRVYFKIVFLIFHFKFCADFEKYF